MLVTVGTRCQNVWGEHHSGSRFSGRVREVFLVPATLRLSLDRCSPVKEDAPGTIHNAELQSRGGEREGGQR